MVAVAVMAAVAAREPVRTMAEDQGSEARWLKAKTKSDVEFRRIGNLACFAVSVSSLLFFGLVSSAIEIVPKLYRVRYGPCARLGI